MLMQVTMTKTKWVTKPKTKQLKDNDTQEAAVVVIPRDTYIKMCNTCLLYLNNVSLVLNLLTQLDIQTLH